MKLTTQQNKIINSKPIKFNILKGKESCGKTTTALYRGLFLKHNYCLFSEDKILIITSENKKQDIISKYDILLQENKGNYMSLFSAEDKEVHIFSLEEIIDLYFLKFAKNQCMVFSTVITEKEKENIIKEAISKLRHIYNDSTLLPENFFEFYKNEICWIKSMNFKDVSEYQEVERINRGNKTVKGPKRLLKNSFQREIIYELMLLYNIAMREKGYVDEEDKSIFAFLGAEQGQSTAYTHIILDGLQKITKTQFDFIRAMGGRRDYSTYTFVIDEDEKEATNGYFVKNRRISSIKDFKVKPKINYLRTSFETESKYNSVFMENYEYLDLRYKVNRNFYKDFSTTGEFIIKDSLEERLIEKKELAALPVYNEIAAGEPLLMNPEVEDYFSLPKDWIRNINNCFILKVKGDSMIGANIEDGDQVIIRKQNTAQHNDIIAIDLDGSATLKRLSKQRGKIELMPENPKYNSIIVENQQASIIGLAVGVIKSKVK